jgi:hypothetical protein
MNWVLIGLAILSPTEFDAYEIGRYNTMVGCFNARAEVLVKIEAYQGIPPVNEQYVCVRTEYGD